MSETDLFGFELLFKTIEPVVHHKSDVIIAVVHWYLIKNSFRNVGIGDDKTLSENDEQSELLPEAWNSNPKVYALRYVNKGGLYILHGLLSEGTMIINLLQVSSLNVSNTTFEIDETVKKIKGKLSTMIPEQQNVFEKVRKELLEPVFNGNKKDGETQTKQASEEARPRPQPNVPFNQRRPGSGDNLFSPNSPLFNIGRGDLDPLGRGGGGGMLFQPPAGFNPLGNLRMPTRPDIIPGARFDPFHTPDPDRRQRPGPDNDHFPPPGYDDMFM